VKQRSMASLVILDQDRVLLLHKQTRYHDRPLWIPSAGGHFEKDELNDPEACLWREVNEEIGLSPDAFENSKLRYIALRHSGDEIRINYYFFGNLRKGVSRSIANNEGALRWFGLEEARSCGMPISFKACYQHYLGIGQKDELVYVMVGETITPL
jgi:8-oxo-dGTP diphosphatase